MPTNQVSHHAGFAVQEASWRFLTEPQRQSARAWEHSVRGIGQSKLSSFFMRSCGGVQLKMIVNWMLILIMHLIYCNWKWDPCISSRRQLKTAVNEQSNERVVEWGRREQRERERDLGPEMMLCIKWVSPLSLGLKTVLRDRVMYNFAEFSSTRTAAAGVAAIISVLEAYWHTCWPQD